MSTREWAARTAARSPSAFPSAAAPPAEWGRRAHAWPSSGVAQGLAPGKGRRGRGAAKGPGLVSPAPGASAGPAPPGEALRYGLGSMPRAGAGHGWARQLWSPVGRGGRLPRSSVSPPSKAAGDRDGKARLRAGAAPPVPVAMPGGGAAQHLVPPPGRRSGPGPCAGGHAPLPRSGRARGRQPHRRPPQPRRVVAPAPPEPPTPKQHAQGSPASLQPTLGGGGGKLCWHRSAPAQETQHHPPATCAAARLFASQVPPARSRPCRDSPEDGGTPG